MYVFGGWSYDSILLILLPTKANILIDQTGHARLADFGLLTIISDPTNLLSSSSYAQGGTARWMSPELIDPKRFEFETSRRTKCSDCYALGMVIYETISGRLPFHQHMGLTVFVRVLAGERPLRGAEFTGDLWNMLERCWEPRPGDRLSIEVVLQCLERTVELVPQRPYSRSRDDQEHISIVLNGNSGINARDAIKRIYGGLERRDDRVLVGEPKVKYMKLRLEVRSVADCDAFLMTENFAVAWVWLLVQ